MRKKKEKKQLAHNSLGRIAKTYSTLSTPRRARPPRPLPDKALHAFKFALQAAARDLLPDERVALCLRLPYSSDGVDVVYSEQFHRANYRGLQTCGSVHHCPICASKIAAERREEIAAAMDGCRAAGGSVAMVTYTLSHHQGDDLDGLLGLLIGPKGAHTKAKQGRWWQDFKEELGIIGTIRALECTHGGNGFHPHLHELFFFNRDFDKHQFLADFAGPWGVRYRAFVRRRGGVVDMAHGVKVDQDMTSDDYLAKTAGWDFSDELARAVVKKAKNEDGRTMPQLLRDYAEGDDEAGAVWRVYANHMKGKRQLFWSRGLKARYGIGEKEDGAIASQDLDPLSILLARIEWAEWKKILQMDRRGELLDMVEVMKFETVRELWSYIGVRF